MRNLIWSYFRKRTRAARAYNKWMHGHAFMRVYLKLFPHGREPIQPVRSVSHPSCLQAINSSSSSIKCRRVLVCKFTKEMFVFVFKAKTLACLLGVIACFWSLPVNGIVYTLRVVMIAMRLRCALWMGLGLCRRLPHWNSHPIALYKKKAAACETMRASRSGDSRNNSGRFPHYCSTQEHITCRQLPQ